MNPGPSHEAVLSALERLLAWPELARSPQLASFLDYIVRRTLAGEEQSIKAYSIAVDVFGRSTDFDPQSDPIVRVQARRLRALLDAYYAQHGSSEVIQIRLPTGRYIPEFVPTPPSAEADPITDPVAAAATTRSAISLRSALVALLFLGLALVAIAAYFGFSNAAPRPGDIHRPVVSVVNFTNLTRPSRDVAMVSALGIELVTDLDQFQFIDARYAGPARPEQASGSDGDDIDFVLTGVAREEGDLVQYHAELTDAQSKVLVWEKVISVTREAAHEPAILDELSRSFSLELGSARGPLHAKARDWALSGENTGQPTNLYLCRALFDLYRETWERAEGERAQRCVLSLPDTMQASPVAIAMSAILSTELSESDSGAHPSGSAEALNDFATAIGASPMSSFIWEQEARLHQALGETDAALADYLSALQLNPANGDALAAAGYLVAKTGMIREARPLVSAALETPEPPPGYFGGAALMALADKNYSDAVQFAERFAEVAPEVGSVLAVVAGQGADDSAAIDRFLPQVIQMESFRKTGVLPRLRETISDPGLLDAIAIGLVSAGLPASALEQPF